MPILLTCPDCSARMRAPDAAAGKVVRCPKCQARIPVPTAAPAFEVVEPPDIEVDDEPVRPKPRRERERDREPERDRPARKAKRKPTRSAGPPVGLLVGLGVLLLGGGAFAAYWFGLRDPKPAAETAQAGPPAPAASPAPA
ncbi:MAG: zinc-ribbon domain-containing protein, partial [Gemmataceae bacterium]|nr:zinc-ribbon domain-containing protein [Gemmataceae bacterium]